MPFHHQKVHSIPIAQSPCHAQPDYTFLSLQVQLSEVILRYSKSVLSDLEKDHLSYQEMNDRNAQPWELQMD